MQCFKWKSNFRKCAICDNKVEDYLRYNLLDDDPTGIVCKCAMLSIRLKEINVSKRNRVLCENCWSNIEQLCIFKNRVGFVNNTVIPQGLMIRSMCSICYHYNPAYMSGTFNDLISSNQCLITYTFQFNFANIVDDMKLTCDDCMRHLYLFCKMHINLQRAHPRKGSMVVDVTKSSSDLSRKLSSIFVWCSKTTPDEVESEQGYNLDENFRKSGPSTGLRRIPSIPQNLDCLQSLYQQESFIDSESMQNPYFYDLVNYEVDDRQSENNSSTGQLSETTNNSSSLEMISAAVDAPAGPSNTAEEQQKAAPEKPGNRVAKLKRLFSKKRKNADSAQTDDQTKESKKSTKGKKRKEKGKKVAEVCEK